jgi:tetratricopeptide (TPR) repeat protein
LLVAAGLVVLDLAVFAQLRGHEFILMDDGLYITKNPSIQHGLTWAGIVWAFTTGHAANWHPLTWLSHMLDIQLFGLWAGGHHLSSVALHVINTLLLFFGLQWITSADGSPTLGRSALVAALFGIHPLHVESVAWAAERKDVLSTLFWWLTIGAYVAYARRPAFWRYALVAVMFVLGLMSKPMLVTVPFVLLLMDVWPLRRSSWVPDWALVREKLPLLALAAASTLITFLVQRQGGAVIELGHLPLSNRLANAVLSYGRYLWKTVWPTHLVSYYSYPIEMPLGAVFVSLVALVALSVAVWRLAGRFPYLGVGWLWFLGTLVPVIGILQVGSQALADRYTYVPLVGILVAAVWGLHDLAARRSIGSTLTTAAASIAVLAFAAVAYVQAGYWVNSVVLWQHAIAVMPENYMAYGALAAIRADEGKSAEALDLFTKAVNADPNFPNSHVDLGYQLMVAGRVDEAAVQYTEALRLNPDYADAHQSLGVVMALKGRVDEAIAHYREAIRIAPGLSTAHVSLGVALAGQGKLDEALKELLEGVRLDPAAASSWSRLGSVYTALGRSDEAISAYREAIRRKPDFAEAHNDLGFLYYRLNRADEAIAEYSEALRVRPAYPEALTNRGMVLGAQKKTREALDDFTEAVRLSPDSEAAHYWRGILLAGIGRYAEARRELEEALRLNPRNDAAKRALNEITRLGK